MQDNIKIRHLKLIRASPIIRRDATIRFKFLSVRKTFEMKKSLSLSLILAGALFACKHTTVTDNAGNGCISRYVPQPQRVVSQSIIDSIDNFFAQNNLSTAGLQFFGWGYGDTIISGVSEVKTIQFDAYQYINGLPVLRNSVYYNFNSNGVYLPPAAGTVPVYTVVGDTVPHQNLQALRQDFLNNYKQCAIYSTVANPQVSHPTAPYQDTCLSAVLGYMDAGYLKMGIPYGKQLVKTWIIYPSDQTFSFYAEYPAVFVADNTGYAFPQVFQLP